MKIIVTGGCGFIGSELIIKLIALGHKVLNIDCITKSSIPESLQIINFQKQIFVTKIYII